MEKAESRLFATYKEYKVVAVQQTNPDRKC